MCRKWLLFDRWPKRSIVPVAGLTRTPSRQSNWIRYCSGKTQGPGGPDTAATERSMPQRKIAQTATAKRAILVLTNAPDSDQAPCSFLYYHRPPIESLKGSDRPATY